MVAAHRFALWLAGAGIATAGAHGSSGWHAAELGHSQQAVWASPQTLVYRDSGSFRSAWTQMYPAAGLRPALPLVDFTKWRVIIVAVGTKPNGGYHLSLERGQTARDSALLTLTLHTPAKGCGVSEELTTPAVAVATPIAPAPFRIIFHERADSAHCN
jgi:PrcB C-terminal